MSRILKCCCFNISRPTDWTAWPAWLMTCTRNHTQKLLSFHVSCLFSRIKSFKLSAFTCTSSNDGLCWYTNGLLTSDYHFKHLTNHKTFLCPSKKISNRFPKQFDNEIICTIISFRWEASSNSSANIIDLISSHAFGVSNVKPNQKLSRLHYLTSVTIYWTEILFLFWWKVSKSQIEDNRNTRKKWIKKHVEMFSFPTKNVIPMSFFLNCPILWLNIFACA